MLDDAFIRVRVDCFVDEREDSVQILCMRKVRNWT